MRFTLLCALSIAALAASNAFAQPMDINASEALKAKPVTNKNELPVTEDSESKESFAGIKIEDVDSQKDVPARTVRISLNSVTAAAGYEIEVIPTKKIWSEPWKFKLNAESTILRLRLSPGRYAVRTRSLAAANSKGRWSKTHFFWVGYRPIARAYPDNNMEIEPKGAVDETIFFQWPAVPGAQWYFFQLKDAQGSPLRYVLTKETYLKSTLKVSSNYSWSTTPLKNRNDYVRLLQAGLPKYFSPFAILGANEKGRGTLVKVEPIKHAKKYEFEVVSVNVDDTEEAAPAYFQSFEPEFRFRLTPGEYEMRVRGLNDNNSSTEWSAPSRFFVKRFLPTPLSPADDQTVEALDDLKSKVMLKWKADPKATFYRVYIYDGDKKLIRTEETNEAFKVVELPDSKNYFWTAKAFSKNEPQDPPSASEATGKFRINQYVKLDMNSAEESSQFYGWYRQISSVENYTGYNYDNNAIVTQKLFGGESELALGYWGRKSRIGILAHGSLAGFQFRSNNYFYSKMGLHVGYRHLLGNGDRMRFWLGYSINENPEILTYPYTTEVVFSKIKNAGPQLQFAYLKSFTDKWGGQVSTSIYRSQTSLETPNGLDQQPTNSYRLSVLASYALSQKWRTSFGYTYQLDQFSYSTTDAINIPNTGKIEGHYLSLMFDVALQDKMK
ncbi:hypothetical protein [Bdellovibrio svalbardensis]|uniref:Fibronectin type-III domain-containing protein n=1 Tax=Bdellovibrio svalbardensis TaxID=2972972 RepID=A0ABT6DH29_9BACT|nr:hypothetical protein [Bdellovibrio svalbardensis]MDG0816176.1 hypothetical protein [Bdellovibrio svalbardensis]